MVGNRKTPKSVDATPLPRFSLGLAPVLAQSKNVVEAFGRWPGFVLMLLAVMGIVFCFSVAVFSTGNAVSSLKTRFFSEVSYGDVSRIGGRAEAPNRDV